MKAKVEEGMSETGIAYCEASKLNEGNFMQVNSLQVIIIHREKCTKTKSFARKIIRYMKLFAKQQERLYKNVVYLKSTP